ncbi:AGRD1-like protein, partial [Mya arenaria]
TGLRSVCVLLPVFGITWLFGVFAVNRNAIVFQYLFVIFNSLQVQEAFKARRTRWFATEVSTTATEMKARYYIKSVAKSTEMSTNCISDDCPYYMYIPIIEYKKLIRRGTGRQMARDWDAEGEGLGGRGRGTGRQRVRDWEAEGE